MPNVPDFRTELAALEADYRTIAKAGDALPAGAHIHGLFMFVLDRIEDLIYMLGRRFQANPTTPRFDAAA